MSLSHNKNQTRKNKLAWQMIAIYLFAQVYLTNMFNRVCCTTVIYSASTSGDVLSQVDSVHFYVNHCVSFK